MFHPLRKILNLQRKKLNMADASFLGAILMKSIICKKVAEVYLEPFQTFKMERFAKIVNSV